MGISGGCPKGSGRVVLFAQFWDIKTLAFRRFLCYTMPYNAIMMFSLCPLCNLCVLCGSFFLPQRAQRIHKGHKGKMSDYWRFTDIFTNSRAFSRRMILPPSGGSRFQFRHYPHFIIFLPDYPKRLLDFTILHCKTFN